MRNITPYKIVDYDGKSQITAPGIYANLPIGFYHRRRDLFGGAASVSSGGLRTVENKSLKHFFHTSIINPDSQQEAEKDAWIMGRATHTLLLGEGGFRQQFAIRPDEYTTDEGEVKPWNGNAKKCKNWLAQAQLDNLQVLKNDAVHDIRGMADALHEHPTIRTGIMNGLVEHSMFWPDGDLWLKSRPDAIPVDSNMIVDLKTCSDASPAAVRRSIGEYGYHMQMALAIEGIRQTTGRVITEAVLVFVETKAPYGINIKPLTQAALARGHQQNLRAIGKIKDAMQSGYWGDYDDDEVPADLPGWLENRLSYEQDKGLLAPLKTEADEAI